jgi:glutamate synthase (NADPH/NADH) small chain
MDSARTAVRLGADETYIVYRRSRTELPARDEEIHHAEQEGIVFKMLCAPVELTGNDKGMIKQMKVQEMELGEPDASGRRRPVPKDGAYFTIDTDLVIIAIGGGANPVLTKSVAGLELNRWGNIVANKTGRTSLEAVWAGGDIVTGSATVIEAMGAGKQASEDIDKFIMDNSHSGDWLVKEEPAD